MKEDLLYRTPPSLYGKQFGLRGSHRDCSEKKFLEVLVLGSFRNFTEKGPVLGSFYIEAADLRNEFLLKI